MAGISTSIQLADHMTPVLQSITAAMNMMVNSMTAAQTATETGFNTAQAVAMQQAVASATAELSQYQDELERVNNTPINNVPVNNIPEIPNWNNVSSQPVFMTSGAERFESEYQAASAAAQQLFKNQQEISNRAMSLRVIPPGMINDVAATENRMQSLANRINELNRIPVNLRTDQVNNELEALRGNLSQAIGIQGNLNAAMRQMDISAANVAYRQLNDLMDSTEKDIRKNLSAQEQFNQSVKTGQTAADGLGGSIKRYAAMIISAATAGKAISLADQVTQTTTRLGLMNQQFGETGDLQQKIYASAQRSRGVYQSTADAVAKLGMQARGAFANTNEVVAFAEQLNKTFVIAGTSAQGVDSVMLQLTQSMASGKLQGEELNAVLDNAQPIVQNIAEYMGVPVGQIKKLASEGAITAEIIKNAMFAAADETNEKFQQMPMTFGQVANKIQNQALMAFQPALQQLSAVAQTEEFRTLTTSVTGAIQTMASGAVQGLNMMGQAAQWVQGNWSWLAPVIAGVTTAIIAYKGAMIAYNVVQGISNGLKTLSAIASVAHGAAITTEMIATTGMTAAQISFNAALLACPLTLVVMAILAVAAVIAVLIHRVGGLRAAWLITVNFVLTQADNLRIGFSTAWMFIQNGIDNMQYGFEAFRAGVLNTIGNLKVRGLSLLQEFINGAIDRINSLIELTNRIAGTSFEVISHVEFATGAAIEEEGRQKQRASELEELRSQNAADKQARQQQIAEQQRAADRARMERQAAIAAAKAEAGSAKNSAEESYADGIGDIAGSTAATAGNTSKMADSMDMAEEDLKSMRDMAEQEVINRFTTAELTVNMGGITNHVSSNMDLDGIGSYLEDTIFEVLETAAEGAY